MKKFDPDSLFNDAITSQTKNHARFLISQFNALASPTSVESITTEESSDVIFITCKDACYEVRGWEVSKEII